MTWIRQKLKKKIGIIQPDKLIEISLLRHHQRRVKELQNLSRNHPHTITDLLTKHLAVKINIGYIYCRLCNRISETIFHIPCECEAQDKKKKQAMFSKLKINTDDNQTLFLQSIPTYVFNIYSTTNFIDLHNSVSPTSTSS